MAAPVVNRATLDLVMEAGAIVAVLALAVVLLGEAGVRLRRAGNPLHRPIGVVRATVLPAVAVLLFLRLVVGLPATDVWVQIAETALWIFCVHAALSFVTEVLFGRAEEGTWRARTPRLLVDLVRGVLVATAAAIVASFVWGLDVREGFAALGLGSIVIGLALQDPLGNLFSGLLVALERPFKVGDWLKIEDRIGRIVEINWRATHIQLGGSETLIVPNPTLAKSSFVNLSRPSPDLRQAVDMSFPASVPPERVKRVLMSVLAETPSVLREPAPAVHTTQVGGAATTYSVGYSVDDVAHAAAVRDALMTRIWYASRREGLLGTDSPPHDGKAAGECGDPLRLLRQLPGITAGRFAGADMAPFGVLMHEYAAGEAIVRQGERLRGFYLVVRGAVETSVRSAGGPPRSLGRLRVGEFFGALQQASEVADMTATADGDTAVLLFQDAALEALLESSPHIYRNVIEAARQRRLQVESARPGAS